VNKPQHCQVIECRIWEDVFFPCWRFFYPPLRFRFNPSPKSGLAGCPGCCKGASVLFLAIPIAFRTPPHFSVLSFRLTPHRQDRKSLDQTPPSAGRLVFCSGNFKSLFTLIVFLPCSFLGWRPKSYSPFPLARRLPRLTTIFSFYSEIEGCTPPPSRLLAFASSLCAHPTYPFPLLPTNRN